MLKTSMLRETHLFFEELIRHDLSITNFLASDFSMLNGRLAKHDGIGAASRWDFQKVSLPAGSHRGGVLTMASVRKVTANGTSTSPVTRGAWVLDRILGTPPKPPPPNVGAIEPDIRSATTIREQLAKHRQIESCASRHTKIDPPGFALESFDVIGGWRENYRSTGNGKPVTIGGKKMPYLEGQKIDPSDVLPDGRKFADSSPRKKSETRRAFPAFHFLRRASASRGRAAGRSCGRTYFRQACSRVFSSRAGSRDREKMDEYFTSVRELEHRMVVAEKWSRKPKPKVTVPPLQNNTVPADPVGKTRMLLDLTHLALQTDSTRLVSMLLLGTSQVPPIQGVAMGHHDLSHHGQDPTKIGQFRLVEQEKMKALGHFLDKLKKTEGQGESLLDRTMVFFSSNLGNAANHSTKNLPVLLAGGGFKHGQHLAFDPAEPPPLSNLDVTMLQRLGIAADKFGTSTGTLTGLEAHA